MKLTVRYLLISFLLIVSFSLVKSPVFAQYEQVQPQAVNAYTAPNTNPDVPNNLHNWTQNVMIEVMSAMTCQLAGIDPTNPSAKCLGVDAKTKKIGFVENGGGAIGLMGNLITMTLTPPIHTGDFIAYATRNFGFAKPTYAASGIDSLNPLVTVWSASRNIVYLLFVLVFVIIGIGIMFRVKIDPRTVMTIQNQIPKLIIAILLVTFSFAIAGLLIDIMWVFIYLFINVLVGADPTLSTANNVDAAGRITSQLYNTTLNFAGQDDIFKGGLLGIATGGAGSVATIIANLVQGSGSAAPGNISVASSIINPIGSFIGTVIGGFIGIIGGILAFFIILIALLWSLFKLWFALLEAYIMILVGVIFAPFWIVTGLIPGTQSMGFGAWLREMLGNIAAFPVAIAMFMIGRILIDAFGTTYSADNFVAPLLGNPQNSTNPFGAIIALGLIFSTPHVVKTTKAAFKSPKIDFGPIGAAIGAGSGAPGRIVSGGANAAFAPNYVRNEKTGMQEIVYPHSGLGKALRAFGVVK